MKSIAFRVDASLAIGTGHIVRCLTLAEALREQGARCSFIGREQEGSLLERVRERGFPVHSLPDTTSRHVRSNSNSHVEDQPDWRVDAERTREVVSTIQPTWLVVDHYALDAQWESVVKPYCGKLMVIDDLADRAHVCDVLLDQNVQRPTRYSSLVPKECQTLIGPRFALLRPQFAAARARGIARAGQARRVLVFFGGADRQGYTLNAARAIEQFSGAEIAVDVVIGPANPHKADIEQACRHLPATTLHCDVSDMATLMASADLFVGAGGSSSWERCCVGLPGIVVATADNQVEQSRALALAGAQIYLGDAASVSPKRLSTILAEVLRLPEMLVSMSERAMRLVDGRGVMRVAMNLLADPLTLRRAAKSDCDNILDWRNHPDSRRFSLNPAPIDLEAHQGWFKNALKDPSKLLLIAESDSAAIGVLRYDIDGETARVSVYLVPGASGKGWGGRILALGEDQLRRAAPHVRVLEAEIRADNIPSVRVFAAAGYEPYRSVYRKQIDG